MIWPHSKVSRHEHQAVQPTKTRPAPSDIRSDCYAPRKPSYVSRDSLAASRMCSRLHQHAHDFNDCPISSMLYDDDGVPIAYVNCRTDFSRPPYTAGSLLAQPPLYSYVDPHEATRCAFPSCARHTYKLSTTTTCPACGPFSYVRYCSVRHLHDDIRRHYRMDCGRRLNPLLLDEKTVASPVRIRRPFVPCIDGATNDSLERHRQAIFWSNPLSNRPNASYVVFTDLDLLWNSKDVHRDITIELLSKYRGQGDVCAVVEFTDEECRKWFERSLQILLSLGQAAKTHRGEKSGKLLVRDVYRSMKGKLRHQGQWDTRMSERMRLAMALEFGWRVPISEW